jgi:hypothetical protein
MTQQKKINETEKELSELGAGGSFRVVSRFGEVSAKFEASLTGIDKNKSYYKLHFDNGVDVEGEGADISRRVKFYRRTW